MSLSTRNPGHAGAVYMVPGICGTYMIVPGPDMCWESAYSIVPTVTPTVVAQWTTGKVDCVGTDGFWGYKRSELFVCSLRRKHVAVVATSVSSVS